MTDSNYTFEQKYLDEVNEKLDIAQKKTEQELARTSNDRADIEKSWGDVRIKTSTYENILDTALSVRQQQQMLIERQNSFQNATNRLQTLKKLKVNPYFARIDFQEKGEEKAETIYIGLGSFSDTPDHFLIYDWRAPISSIYYDGGLGNVEYMTPDGKQNVDVKLKRQFQIEDGVIVTIFDTDEAVGDQMLLDALSGESDTKMKSIVTTIQKEQNKIIRNTSADLLFVQGAAGSGKTAAVLQRVAYLLYRYRGNLNSGQVVLFSPNQLFNDYIDQVLPELGEQNMVQMTYYQYAMRRLPKIQVETLQERFEEHNDAANENITRFKGSLAFFKLVAKYAQTLNKGNLRFKDINFQGKPFFDKEHVAKIYYGYNEQYKLGQRLDATKERLASSLNGRIGNELKEKWVEEAIQNLTKTEIDSLFGDQPREFASEEKEYNFLARKIVVNAFKPIATAIHRNRFINVNAQFAAFLRSVPKMTDLSKWDISATDWEASVERTVTEFKTKQMTLADVSTYLYLYDLITGKHGERDIRFVFIDEIQDYSAFQLAFLKFSFPKAKFTMLGDLNQAIFTKENSKTLLHELGSMFDPEKTSVVQLTKTYRSTQQITDFSKELLVNGEQIIAFNRNGAKPVLAQFDTMAAMEARLIKQIESNNAAHETTAIITKSLAEGLAVDAVLKAANVKATLIRSENQRLVPGVIIVPSYLAKGLEFDAVVAWDISVTNYPSESERQLIYTIASRAMHELTLLACGPVTPLLDRVNPDLYEVE
ncbi:RNA polymerase recycling motor HelD [Periweissella ghanensis]|uniref:DNA helicase IV n=1 Tax=Periweissella ghanensis TaxID=467997 RepID=A0ABM8ZCN0_9LACO|nr:RNA polymerase recycling motor HelD [Periweissella ghanensis]MCM0601896.1 AAA family ATPase [Periweissella ghanensis]CAH0418913.1 DNA helicase IV [Periweissella ghanensis]